MSNNIEQMTNMLAREIRHIRSGAHTRALHSTALAKALLPWITAHYDTPSSTAVAQLRARIKELHIVSGSSEDGGLVTIRVSDLLALVSDVPTPTTITQEVSEEVEDDFMSESRPAWDAARLRYPDSNPNVSFTAISRVAFTEGYAAALGVTVTDTPSDGWVCPTCGKRPSDPTQTWADHFHGPATEGQTMAEAVEVGARVLSEHRACVCGCGSCEQCGHNITGTVANHQSAAVLSAVGFAALLAKVVPVPCVMTHTPPFDFAQCETHDSTFPLGGTCRFQGREAWEVYSDEADEQRGRAVLAEDTLEEIHAAVSKPYSASPPYNQLFDAVREVKDVLDTYYRASPSYNVDDYLRAGIEALAASHEETENWGLGCIKPSHLRTLLAAHPVEVTTFNGLEDFEKLDSLPVGSIVYGSDIVAIRGHVGAKIAWRMTNGGHCVSAMLLHNYAPLTLISLPEVSRG